MQLCPFDQCPNPCDVFAPVDPLTLSVFMTNNGTLIVNIMPIIIINIFGAGTRLFQCTVYIRQHSMYFSFNFVVRFSNNDDHDDNSNTNVVLCWAPPQVFQEKILLSFRPGSVHHTHQSRRISEKSKEMITNN